MQAAMATSIIALAIGATNVGVAKQVSPLGLMNAAVASWVEHALLWPHALIRSLSVSGASGTSPLRMCAGDWPGVPCHHPLPPHMLRGRHRQSVENVRADEQATPVEQELWPPVSGAGGR
jgi:hypothetical protein